MTSQGNISVSCLRLRALQPASTQLSASLPASRSHASRPSRAAVGGRRSTVLGALCLCLVLGRYYRGRGYVQRLLATYKFCGRAKSLYIIRPSPARQQAQEGPNLGTFPVFASSHLASCILTSLVGHRRHLLRKGGDETGKKGQVARRTQKAEQHQTRRDGDKHETTERQETEEKTKVESLLP